MAAVKVKSIPELVEFLTEFICHKLDAVQLDGNKVKESNPAGVVVFPYNFDGEKIWLHLAGDTTKGAVGTFLFLYSKEKDKSLIPALNNRDKPCLRLSISPKRANGWNCKTHVGNVDRLESWVKPARQVA